MNVPISTQKTRGFSLLELLIALVVFSIGLLAIAGLQTVSKQANFEAVQRTTAAQVAKVWPPQTRKDLKPSAQADEANPVASIAASPSALPRIC